MKNLIIKNIESIMMYKELLSTLSDEALLTPMPAGWTVSAVLVHLAFWDLRALNLLRKWRNEGIYFSPMDIDVINEVTRLICLAVQPRAAVELFLRTAESINEFISDLDEGWMKKVEEEGKNVHLDRAAHRLIHLAEIKVALEYSQ